MSKNAELARLYYIELRKIIEKTPVDEKECIRALNQLLHAIIMQATINEKLAFTTFFSRLAYAFQKYSVASRTQFIINEFRRSVFKNEPDHEKLLGLGGHAIVEAVKSFFDGEVTTDVLLLIPTLVLPQRSTKIIKKRAVMRVVILNDDLELQQFTGYENNTHNKVHVLYNITGVNENFRDSVEAIKKYFTLPITLNLIEVEILEQSPVGIGRERSILMTVQSRAFVIEPDYLMDVTAVAECFKYNGTEVNKHIINKFLPHDFSQSITLGNIANFFLDELVADSTAEFQKTFPKVFKINPLVFSLMESNMVRDIQTASQIHWINIKRVLHENFPKVGITAQDCYLEPSFYAPKYGLQGRLDLFFRNRENLKTAIVELKSGKTFRPNQYGINANHFIQTLLYDLLIDATFGDKHENLNYILYSVVENDNLKFAPPIKSLQYEALNVRNKILGLEKAVISCQQETVSSEQPEEITQSSKLKAQSSNVFEKIIADLTKTASGFEKRDLDIFQQTYFNMSDLERNYFLAFSAFIMREHHLSKIGIQGNEDINGQATLWLDDVTTKEENFSILSHLTILENKSFNEDALIILKRSEKTNPLANFRVGDIVVLYPLTVSEQPSAISFQQEDEEADSLMLTASSCQPIHNQVFKCTLVSFSQTQITLRFRNRQFNQYLFEHCAFWNVEHDLLDSSFVSMTRNLFAFMQAPKEKRDLLLTLRPPNLPIPDDDKSKIENRKLKIEEMTDEQNLIFKKIIYSQDYFLLWGPPGTGKTSVMLKNLVGYFFKNTDQNILLLAYTNRAVDEICEAIERLGDVIKNNYLRIGSRFGTDERFHEQLLDKKIESIKNRKELIELIAAHRIVVGTVASISGKPELFQLKKFDRVFIDEASQILEPQLIGLLPKVSHFTLIGDHKQLPAVVQQSSEDSATNNVLLESIGLKNTRNSFFERLYRRALENKWDWAYSILSHQGRMHADIMQFPSEMFYENKLRILPDILGKNQTQLLTSLLLMHENKVLANVVNNRVSFIHINSKSVTPKKMNENEAKSIAKLVQAFEEHYFEKKLSIGIITPFRAQIATIKNALKEKNIPEDAITIDTVERYQGGARDIILISLCITHPRQLTSLVSLSEEGVDRKLNVALTRAKQHLIVLGNAEILNESVIYKEFITRYGVV